MKLLPKQLLAQDQQTEFLLCSMGKPVAFNPLDMIRRKRIETLKHLSEALAQVSNSWDNFLALDERHGTLCCRLQYEIVRGEVFGEKGSSFHCI